MTAAAPSGVVTFLFSEVEGSTRRWEADAAAMRAALMAHDEVLRSSIEAHDGFLFSHTGDGVVAAFASPKCAVDAAVAAQRALELPVRMGLATGEAELRDGDYFGTVLGTARALGIDELLDSVPSRQRDLVMAMLVAQVIAPASKLATARGLRTETATSARPSCASTGRGRSQRSRASRHRIDGCATTLSGSPPAAPVRACLRTSANGWPRSTTGCMTDTWWLISTRISPRSQVCPTRGDSPCGPGCRRTVT